MDYKEIDKNRCYVICPNPSIDIQAKINEFRPKQPTRIQSEAFYPGGKGTHVAMALSEMGLPSTLLGIWGDQNGSNIQQECSSYYPMIRFEGPVVKGYNRSCYSFISEGEWSDTELLGRGPRVPEDIYLQLINILKRDSKFIVSVAICGSWPNGASEFSTQKIVEFCNEIGIPVFIDTTGKQLENALVASPYLVHLNRREVCNLYDLEFNDAIKEISKYCDVAAITDGKNGLVYKRKSSTLQAKVSLKKEVLSSIGCGDCLTAGLIRGHYEEMSNEDIAKLGVACGAANCIRPELGMLHHSDVKRLQSNATTIVL